MEAQPKIVHPLKPILRLGTPLIAFFFIQNLINLATLAMLGRLGNAALAGVGAAGAIYGVVLALLFGFDTGVQAIASRTTGAGREGRLGEVLADAIAASAAVGALIAVAFWTLGPGVLAAMLPDKAAVAAGSANMMASAPSLLFYSLTIPINASWIGSGRPSIAFLVSLALAPVQILLALLLVFGAGPVAAEGAAGSGAALSLATLIGVGVQFALALRLRPGFMRTAPRPAGIVAIAAIGWPVSVQQSLSQFGLIVAFIIVGRLGNGPTAVINVLVSLMAFPIQSATGLGVAAATLVGQSLGRGDPGEARRWGWRTAAVGAALLAPFGLIAVAAPELVLGQFLRDPATLALAIGPARILGLAVSVIALGIILGFAFRGAGATKIAAGIPFASLWLLQLPLMWWIGVTLGQGVSGMVNVQVGIAVVDAVLLAWLWRGAAWTAVRIGAPDIPVVPEGLARIAILGGAGAGKSTLARRIGEARGLPVVHLDRLVFGPGWSRTEVPLVRQRLAAMLEPGAWVVEGTYPELADLSLPHADLVIWVDQPAWLRLWRTWRKTRLHRGRPRADRPDGCEEGFNLAYARTVLKFGAWSPALERRLTEAAGRPPLRLRGDRAAARFVAGLSSP